MQNHYIALNDHLWPLVCYDSNSWWRCQLLLPSGFLLTDFDQVSPKGQDAHPWCFWRHREYNATLASLVPCAAHMPPFCMAYAINKWWKHKYGPVWHVVWSWVKDFVDEGCCDTLIPSPSSPHHHPLTIITSPSSPHHHPLTLIPSPILPLPHPHHLTLLTSVIPSPTLTSLSPQLWIYTIVDTGH